MLRQSFVYLTKGKVPDGYFGDWADVEFYFDISTGKTIAANEKWGWFTFGTPTAIDAREAMWLLENHPASNARFETI